MSSQKSKWDLGRFVKTLSYFGAVPWLSKFDWFQKWFGSRRDPNLSLSSGPQLVPGAASMNPQRTGVILVAGATGGVGKRVVRRLREQGYQVRSLVREIDRAQAILGEPGDYIQADITQPQTLTPAVIANVKAVISCVGVRVQPVEGDTPDRQKYYQGVKFYQPEVVGDTPEAVEYQGVKNLIEAVAEQLQAAAAVKQILFDFQAQTQDLKESWGAVDDVVMGGVSQSDIRLANSVALFSGQVSTANSGGFASVRTRNFEPAINLAAFDGVELHLQGDGQRYKFMLRNQTTWDGVAYAYSFDTVADSWITVRIPFAELTPVFRAKTVAEDSLDASQIRAFQLMLSKFEYDGDLNPDFQPGTFELKIKSIQAYRAAQLPQFVMVSSAGVTRPGRSDLDLAAEPPAVRMNDQLGGILTWKLRAEESLRNSGLAYTIVRPCALTEEFGGEALVFAQGNTLKGQVSREDIAELCAQALEQPQACNLTFEVATGNSDCAPGEWNCLFSKLQPDPGAE